MFGRDGRFADLGIDSHGGDELHAATHAMAARVNCVTASPSLETIGENLARCESRVDVKTRMRAWRGQCKTRTAHLAVLLIELSKNQNAKSEHD